jgi:hypothetical protein
METLLLLELLWRGGECYLKDLGPNVYPPRVRIPLTRPGYVSEELAHAPLAENKRKTRRMPLLKLTQEGLALVDRLLEGGFSSLPERSYRSVRVMKNLMVNLGSQMKKKRLTPSKLFSPPPARARGKAGQGTRPASAESPAPKAPVKGSPPAKVPESPAPEAIVPAPEVFLGMLRNMPPHLFQSGGGIKIAAVKAHFPALPPSETDRLLIELQKRERIVLYSHTSPDFVTPEDRKFAVVVAGEPRHIMYFK